jgi:hypothetical protein
VLVREIEGGFEAESNPKFEPWEAMELDFVMSVGCEAGD